MVKPEHLLLIFNGRMNYARLVEFAQNLEKAQRIVRFLDDNPEIRNDLAGIYFRAKETLKNAKG